MAKHHFRKEEDGSVDVFALDADYHNGPYCLRCDEYFCMHCNRNVLTEECPGYELEEHGQLPLIGDLLDEEC